MAQVLSQADRERQKRNSQAEQLDLYRRTGRVTKGMRNQGYLSVAPTSFVAEDGDSPFSVAAQILGPNATQSQIAAFAQAQGWDYSFRSGKTYKVRGAFLDPRAKPSSGYMAQVRGEGAAYNAGNWNSETGAGGPALDQQQAPIPGSGVQSMPSPYSPTQSTQGIGNLPAPTFDAPTAFGSALQNQYAQTFGGDASNTRPTYNPTQATQGIRSGQPQAGIQRGGYNSYSPQGNVGRPSSPAQTQALVDERIAVQAQETSAIVEQAMTNNTVAGMPVSMSNQVFEQVDWARDEFGNPISPYVQYGGHYILSAEYVAAVNNYNASAGGGSAYTGWQREDAIGVSPYLRPRRGGTNAMGSSLFSPTLDGGLSLDTSWGGSLLTSHRIGF